MKVKALENLNIIFTNVLKIFIPKIKFTKFKFFLNQLISKKFKQIDQTFKNIIYSASNNFSKFK